MSLLASTYSAIRLAVAIRVVPPMRWTSPNPASSKASATAGGMALSPPSRMIEVTPRRDSSSNRACSGPAVGSTNSSGRPVMALPSVSVAAASPTPDCSEPDASASAPSKDVAIRACSAEPNVWRL